MAAMQPARQPARQRAAANPSALHSILALPAQPAAQFRHVPPKPVDSDAKTRTFRTNQAANNGDVETVYSEERLLCETVPSINPDHTRSQAEACNSHVKHFDSSALKTGSDDAAKSASSFSKTNNASQMFSSTEN